MRLYFQKMRRPSAPIFIDLNQTKRKPHPPGLSYLFNENRISMTTSRNKKILSWLNYLILLLALLILLAGSLFARQFRFSLKAPKDMEQGKWGIRGSAAPLSWEKSLYLIENPQNGRHEMEIDISTEDNRPFFEYKYVFEAEETTWELDEKGNRLRLFAAETTPNDRWDHPRPLQPGEIAALRYSPEQLQADYQIVREAYLSLHPGLYNYNSSAEMEAHFGKLAEAFQEELSLSEAYLALTRFTASIQCGHTWVNAFNQSTLVTEVVQNRADKLPFTFRLIEGRMLVTRNASTSDQLSRGVEITHINGHSVASILQAMLPLTEADGPNDNKRYKNLEIGGLEQWEEFDIFYSLLFPFENPVFQLQGKNLLSGKEIDLQVPAVKVKERREILRLRYDDYPKRVEDRWSFRIEGDAAILQLGTFSVWHFKTDWKAFLDDAFEQTRQAQAKKLIVDLRGNGGGLDAVAAHLSKFTTKQKVEMDNIPGLVRFNQIPKNLKPHLSTWSSMDDLTKGLIPYDDQYFTYENHSQTEVLKPGKDPFEGKVYFLIDASNSSATHLIARRIKQYGLGTLVGQTTGGSQRGINGGQVLFLKLPNSGIEMDIPMFTVQRMPEAPPGGIEPDIYVKPSVDAVIKGLDAELAAALKD